MIELTYTKSGAKEDERRRWLATGPKGVIELWSDQIRLKEEEGYTDALFGGIEVHSRQPLSYQTSTPSHTDCKLTGGDCWHDGSSLAFDRMLRYLTDDPDDDAVIFEELRSWYVSTYGDEA